MTEPQAPKIAFPCENYPIKAMGLNTASFKAMVLEVMALHAPGFDYERVSVRTSGKDRFQSVTVYITATGEQQLQAIFDDLKCHPDTRMVL